MTSGLMFLVSLQPQTLSPEATASVAWLVGKHFRVMWELKLQVAMTLHNSNYPERNRG